MLDLVLPASPITPFFLVHILFLQIICQLRLLLRLTYLLLLNLLLIPCIAPMSILGLLGNSLVLLLGELPPVLLLLPNAAHMGLVVSIVELLAAVDADHAPRVAATPDMVLHLLLL